jgi:hypothetical protein
MDNKHLLPKSETINSLAACFSTSC